MLIFGIKSNTEQLVYMSDLPPALEVEGAPGKPEREA
jgi:hypothetical protein